jgi:hypothetical protein
MFSFSKIRHQIMQYNLQQIINSGENDMFDNKIDIQKVTEYLQQQPQKQEDKLNISKTLDDMNKDKLFESIINLKNKK